MRNALWKSDTKVTGFSDEVTASYSRNWLLYTYQKTLHGVLSLQLTQTSVHRTIPKPSDARHNCTYRRIRRKVYTAALSKPNPKALQLPNLVPYNRTWTYVMKTRLVEASEKRNLRWDSCHPIKAKNLIEVNETTISIRFLNKKLLYF